ncbi:hypothetical protein F7734_55940 [Scytonema sp. UIC 10036]|uniref:hypothetical protein n=1 Tax=Scytonema sp. UIC 10036 TaxID=2304196 RepID=UPI0012DAB911|nr:hypothetical protein [Scytonema sp. UIC 10036]MUH01070.1 hypothetical protein [Scytonema sp. UIC 10036]
MDEAIEKIGTLGLPRIILVVIVATTGLMGIAAIIAAFAVVSGLVVLLGGIAVLGLTVIYRLKRQFELHGKKLEEIDSLSVRDDLLKAKLKVKATDSCACATERLTQIADVTKEVIVILENVPGMTRAHHRDFPSSRPIVRLRDGASVRIWRNLFGVDHVFLADRDDRMIYGGFVSWIHSEGFNKAIATIINSYK